MKTKLVQDARVTKIPRTIRTISEMDRKHLTEILSVHRQEGSKQKDGVAIRLGGSRPTVKQRYLEPQALSHSWTATNPKIPAMILSILRRKDSRQKVGHKTVFGGSRLAVKQRNAVSQMPLPTWTVRKQPLPRLPRKKII